MEKRANCVKDRIKMCTSAVQVSRIKDLIGKVVVKYDECPFVSTYLFLIILIIYIFILKPRDRFIKSSFFKSSLAK